MVEVGIVKIYGELQVHVQLQTFSGYYNITFCITEGYFYKFSHKYIYSLDWIPYMAKHSRGKTFAVFMVFYSIANVFPQIMALSIGNVSLQACYHKSFPANNNFPL